MEVVEIDTSYPPADSGEERSEGLHLTDIVKSIEKDMGWDYKGKGFQDRELTMDLGFTWEQVLSTAHADRRQMIRPGEVEKDGITGSPDGIGPNPGLQDDDGDWLVEPSKEIILFEHKLTWKSSKNVMTSNWYYLTQGKSYCAMTGMKVVFWELVYLNGNYRGSGPLYRKCWVRFDDDEIKRNWEMIVTHAQEKGWL